MTALRAPTDIRMADEEPAFFSRERWADVVFDEIVIDFEASVIEITRERFVVVEGVMDSLPNVVIGNSVQLKRFLRASISPYPVRLSVSPPLNPRRSGCWA